MKPRREPYLRAENLHCQELHDAMNRPSEKPPAQATVNPHNNLPKGEGAANAMDQKSR